MEKLGLNEIRQAFTDFFVSKGHYAAGSASLIPQSDKSLLIINSGMAPLKPYFAGLETPPSTRMTTCQKCIRTGDIENVGITSRHGTFFEMLGNFSFGDYFKEESLTWGWEFITEVLKMPKDKLWATIYEDDDQAHDIWIKLGMPENKIVRLGKDDNFWEIGLGPCGPCSEIYFDRGEEYSCGKPNCKPGCECDRYIEFWNHVFTQFSKEEDGSYSNLKHPNIDTGMGLERMACIMQGVNSIFDVDTIKHILDAVTELANVKYEAGNEKDDISIRIITDHIRSMVFMIADGILPSNEGRGYILRRLLRRASRHGKMLGIENDCFLSDLADKVIEVSGGAYPEIVENRDYIKKIISVEEEKFSNTLNQGLQILNEYIEDVRAAKSDILDGDHAFKLYDTYGFPIELTEEILNESGINVDHEGFNKLMENQKELARSGQKSTEEEAWKDAAEYDSLEPTAFVGYDLDECDSKILYYGNYDSKHKLIITEETPFYATSGGQKNDIGEITVDGKTLNVINVIKENDIFLHIIDDVDSAIELGIKPGEIAHLSIDIVNRHKTACAHSATHLLQQALRDVLGDHVMQAGSFVDSKYLRFDFSHFQSMTAKEIAEVEHIVNVKINEFNKIDVQEMPIEEAKKLGAMAIFGEKYGDVVRVVTMGDYSIEFCGGTHLDNTGKIGAFHIISESGIASGVRRIEAVVSTNVSDYLAYKQVLIDKVTVALKTNEGELLAKINQLIDENKDLEKTIKSLKDDEVLSSIDDIFKEAKTVNGVNLITKSFKNTDVEQLRNLCDALKEKDDKLVIVLSSVNDGKVVFIVSISDLLVAKGYHAGKLIKEISKAAGGGGGGKADMAQAGAKDPGKIDAAFAKAEQLISN